MSTFGRLFRITTAGESHSPAVTVIVEGVPAGIYLSLRRHVQPFMDRRRPGQSDLTTPRTETDTVEISSGIEQKHLMYYYNYTPHPLTGTDKIDRYPLSDVLTPKSWLLDGEGPDISSIYVEKKYHQQSDGSKEVASYPTPEEIEAIRQYDEMVLLADRSQGITLGTPLSLTVRNKDTKKNDYNFMNLLGGCENGSQSSSFIPRPSHGDLSYYLKYGGHVASSGGGRSSARETVARVVGGAVAQRVMWWLAWGGTRGRRSDLPTPQISADNYQIHPLLIRSDVSSSALFSPSARSVTGVRIPVAFPRVVAYTLQVGGVSGTSIPVGKRHPVEEITSSSASALNPEYPFVDDESADVLGNDMHTMPSAGTLLTNQLLGLAHVKTSSSAAGSFTRFLEHRSAVEVTSRAPPSKAILQTDMAIRHKILESGKAHDSIGGIVRCVIENCPFGLGEPVFDKLEAMLAHAMMSIPASKGFLMGYGVGFASACGSTVNDRHMKTPANTCVGVDDGSGCNGGFDKNVDGTTPSLSTKTNHSGGVCGGISNGGRIYFDVIFKPPATIGVAQETCDSIGNPTVLAASGRHDPCVVPRAVPVVEAMAMAVLLDCIFVAH